MGYTLQCVKINSQAGENPKPKEAKQALQQISLVGSKRALSYAKTQTNPNTMHLHKEQLAIIIQQQLVKLLLIKLQGGPVATVDAGTASEWLQICENGPQIEQISQTHYYG